MASRFRSTNPVFTRMRPNPDRDELSWRPGAGGLPPTPQELARQYRQPSSLTVDDVVMHTLGVIGLAVVGGLVGWLLQPTAPGLVFGVGIAALVLSLVVGFTGWLNPTVVVVFALLAGCGAGGVSHAYESLYSGIILQALIGTALIFVTMLVAYRSRHIRATPRMARIVGAVLLSVIALSLIDLVLWAFGGPRVPIMNDATPLGILFSVVVLIFASLQFILDFDMIERMIAERAPRSAAWHAAYGLLIGFLWVYLEMLRLLWKLREL
ncbi:MAG: Bax inhibitor-1/YccA family protein [Frankia sp.]|nr:Bax inhibitor-1/YccA family protein [Frankia sp.]